MSLEVRREISQAAIKELEEWQECARTWPFSSNDTCYMCGDCGVLIHQLFDRNNKPYNISGEDLLALEVSHLRSRHGNALDIRRNNAR